MRLSDSPAVEVLRLERLAVQQRLTLARTPTARVTLAGATLGSLELDRLAREAIVEACERFLERIDDDLQRLGVDASA